jgi:hypothetical protein
MGVSAARHATSPASDQRPTSASTVSPEPLALAIVQEPKKRLFAALDREVARVVHDRAPAQLYSYLASAWYEFASADRLADMRKNGRLKIPGDWVRVSYRDFMTFLGTKSRDSVSRWIRVLEEKHECPWGNCSDPHPLIVVSRDGRGFDNRYRRWKCGSDVFVVRERVTSRRLSEAAADRVARRRGQSTSKGQLPLVADAAVPPATAAPDSSSSAAAAVARNVTVVVTEVRQPDFKATSDAEPTEVRLADLQKTDARSASSPPVGQLEVRPLENHKSDVRTSLHGKRENTTDFVGSISPKVAEDTAPAAAVNKGESATAASKDERDAESEDLELDAVACEAVAAIMTLVAPTEPNYRVETAWAVARRLAAVALKQNAGEPVQARAMLGAAIADRRVTNHPRPVAMLIRGVVGKKDGDPDRFLLAQTSSAGTRSASKSVEIPKLTARELAQREEEAAETAHANAVLDRRAAAYLAALPPAELAALEDEQLAKFGSMSKEHIRRSHMMRNLVILSVKKMLTQNEAEAQ